MLDIGFNLLTQLPEDGLRSMASLTLLALDGNPLSTLPEGAFTGLRDTLRGLSLGGRFLTCDCRIRWIAQWINDADLQVTSRERNPQFCGNPPEFRDRTFYQLNAEGGSPRTGNGYLSLIDFHKSNDWNSLHANHTAACYNSTSVLQNINLWVPYYTSRSHTHPDMNFQEHTE